MPDIFDQLAAVAPPARKGDIFDELAAGPIAPPAPQPPVNAPEAVAVPEPVVDAPPGSPGVNDKMANAFNVTARTIGSGISGIAQGVADAGATAEETTDEERARLNREITGFADSTQQVRSNRRMLSSQRSSILAGNEREIQKRALRLSQLDRLPDAAARDAQLLSRRQESRDQALALQGARSPEALAETYQTNPDLESGIPATTGRVVGNIVNVGAQGIAGSMVGAPMLPVATIALQAGADARNQAEANFRKANPTATDAEVQAAGTEAEQHAQRIATASGAAFMGTGAAVNAIAGKVIPATLSATAGTAARVGAHAVGNVTASTAIRGGEALLEGKTPREALSAATTFTGEGIGTDIGFAISGLPGAAREAKAALVKSAPKLEEAGMPIAAEAAKAVEREPDPVPAAPKEEAASVEPAPVEAKAEEVAATADAGILEEFKKVPHPELPKGLFLRRGGDRIAVVDEWGQTHAKGSSAEEALSNYADTRQVNVRAKNILTLEEARARLKIGQLSQINPGACYEMAGTDAMNGNGEMVIGVLEAPGKPPIWHAVTADPKGRYLHDGTVGASMKPEDYSALVGKFTEVTRVSGNEVEKIGKETGKYPSPLTLDLGTPEEALQRVSAPTPAPEPAPVVEEPTTLTPAPSDEVAKVNPPTPEQYQKAADETWRGTADTAPEPTPADARNRIISAYQELKAETGFPAVPIADVAERAGLPLDAQTKGHVADLFQQGDITSLSHGDWSLADPRKRAWGVRTAGDIALLMRMGDDVQPSAPEARGEAPSAETAANPPTRREPRKLPMYHDDLTYSVIHPSAKNPGMFQVTNLEKETLAPVGDTQHPTLEDAIHTASFRTQPFEGELVPVPGNNLRHGAIGTNATPGDLARIREMQKSGETPDPVAPAATPEPERAPETTPAPEAAPGPKPETATPEQSAAPEMEDGPTSIQNSVVDRERAKRGLPPAMEAGRRKFGKVWDDAMRRIDADPDASLRLVDELEREPRPLKDYEDAMLLHRQITLQNAFDRATQETVDAFEGGDRGLAEEGRLRSAAISDELLRTYNADKTAGRENARGLNARKMVANEDYTLATMVTRKRAGKGGAKLTEAEQSEVQQQAAEIDRLKKALAEATAKDEHDTATATAQGELDDVVTTVKPRAAKPPKPPKARPEAAAPSERTANWLERQAEAARKRINDRKGKMHADPLGVLTAVDLADRVIVGAADIAGGLRDFAGWASKQLADWGESIKPHLQDIWDRSNAMIAQHEAVSTIADRVSERVKAGEALGDMRPLVRKMAEAIVRSGVTELEPFLDTLHPLLEEIAPGTTRRQAMDLFSGYGEYRHLSKDQVAVQVRDLSGQSQQTAKIEDMMAKIAPKKTGGERRTPSDIERRLIKVVNELKKLGGFTVKDRDTQLRTALQSQERALSNAIKDIANQIDTGEMPPPRGVSGTNERIESLKALLARLKDTREELFGSKNLELTDEQRLKLATESATRMAEEYERQVREEDVSRKQGKPKLTSPELEAAKARRDAARAERDEFKELSDEIEGRTAERREKQLTEQIAEIDRKLREGDLATKSNGTKGEPSDNAESLKAERDAMQKELDRQRREADPSRAPSEVEKRRIEALQKDIAELDRKLKTGDLATKPKPTPNDSNDVEALKSEREALQKELAKQRREADPRRAPSEVERRKLEAIQKGIDELDQKLKTGDLSTKPKAAPNDSPAAESLKAERAALLQKLGELRRDAKRPVLTAAEKEVAIQRRALAGYKTRTAKRQAELAAKLAAGDFSPPPPRRTLKLDADALRAKADLQRVQNDYERGLIRDRMAKRDTWERALDGASKWRRAFVLSGVHTLAKLASAASEIIAFAPVEEAAGGVIGKVPGLRRVASKAPRHGGLNVRAEVEAISANVTHLFSDIGDYLSKGGTDLDEVYGKPHLYPFEWKEMLGRMHGALKTPARRNEFTRSFRKRMEHAAAQGADVTDPLVQTKISLDAYKDADKAIFMESNMVVDAYRRAVARFGQPDKTTGKPTVRGKAAETVANLLLPVVRIPTNVVARTFEYALGTVIGGGRLVKAFHGGIENLPEEHADLIMQNLKRGSVGAAVMLLGFLNPKDVGGYYFGKRDDKDVKGGNLRIYGHEIPKFLIHNPLLEMLQIGATVRRVMDSKLHKNDPHKQGAWAGVWAASLGLVSEVPFVSQMVHVSKLFSPTERAAFFGELSKSILVPQGVQELASFADRYGRNHSVGEAFMGETPKREAKGVMQHLETGVPGLRQNVPLKKKTP